MRRHRWLLLFILCWPLAVLALVAYPLIWLLSLPFRLVGLTVSAVFEFLRALLLLPAPEGLTVAGQRMLAILVFSVILWITEAVSFVGLGHKFQIWEPARFRAQLAEATEKVRALKKQLGSRVAAHEAQGARE